MPRLPILLALLAAPLCLPAPAHARDIGRHTFFISEDSATRRDLGDTYRDRLDPNPDLRFQFTQRPDGASTVTALQLSDPEETVWSTSASFQAYYRIASCFDLPDRLVLLGDDVITALDKKTGKELYRTPGGNFLKFVNRGTLVQNLPADTVYFVDALEQAQSQDKRNRNEIERPDEIPAHACTLARFDLTTGQFVWKTPAIRPDGRKIVIYSIDGQGILNAARADSLFFDPATGKVLADKPHVPVATAYNPNTLSTGDIQFALASGHTVTATNTATDKLLWTAEVPAASTFVRIISPHHVLVQNSKTLQALAPDTGALIYELPIPAARKDAPEPPPVVSEPWEQLFVISAARTSAYNGLTGKELWHADVRTIPGRQTFSGTAMVFPAPRNDHEIPRSAPNLPPDVTALDRVTGKPLWTFSFPPEFHYPDGCEVFIQPCKSGTLIHLNWIILD